jgi:hypothetical protein
MWKKWTALGLLAALVLAPLSACTPQQVCTTPTCPIAHWPMNEGNGATQVQDVVASPIFNHGTPQPGPVVAWPGFTGPTSVTGQVNGALYFPGNGATKVVVPSTSDLNLGYGSLYLEAYVARCSVGPTPISPSWTSGTLRGKTVIPFYANAFVLGHQWNRVCRLRVSGSWARTRHRSATTSIISSRS